MAMGRVTRRAQGTRRSPGCAWGAGEWLNMAFIPRNCQLLSEPSPVTSFPSGTGQCLRLPSPRDAGLGFPEEPWKKELPHAPNTPILSGASHEGGVG